MRGDYRVRTHKATKQTGQWEKEIQVQQRRVMSYGGGTFNYVFYWRRVLLHTPQSNHVLIAMVNFSGKNNKGLVLSKQVIDVKQWRRMYSQKLWWILQYDHIYYLFYKCSHSIPTTLSCNNKLPLSALSCSLSTITKHGYSLLIITKQTITKTILILFWLRMGGLWNACSLKFQCNVWLIKDRDKC